MGAEDFKSDLRLADQPFLRRGTVERSPMRTREQRGDDPLPREQRQPLNSGDSTSLLAVAIVLSS